MGRRDFDFPQKVITAVRMRCGHVCSKPSCREYTVSLAQDGKLWVGKGEAGHIHSGAPNGPRYDAALSLDQLKSLDNAIWLCGDCHKIVDATDSKIDAQTLKRWKKEAEAYVASNEHIPAPPSFKVIRVNGTLPIDRPGRVDANSLPEAEWQLEIENKGSQPIYSVFLQLQWIEPVEQVRLERVRCPECNVEIADRTTKLTPRTAGRGEIEFFKSVGSRRWLISLSELRPGSALKMGLTKQSSESSHTPSVRGLIISSMSLEIYQDATVDASIGEVPLPGLAESHATVQFMYQHGSQYYPRQCFVWFREVGKDAIEVHQLNYPPPVQFSVIEQENNQTLALSTGGDGEAVIFGPVIDLLRREDAPEN